MTSRLIACIRLAICQVRDGPMVRRLLEAFPAPEMIFDEDPARVARSAGIGEDRVLRLRGSALAEEAEREVERAGGLGARIIFMGGPDYPSILTEIRDPPAALYCLGGILAADAATVAVVGARRPTPYGIRIARDFARELSRAGVTVVSGLARGIDGSAHLGALEGGGRTLAVLGSGLGRIYPAEHHELACRIARQGALLSEFPVDTPPLPYHFPRRNRLISGLSCGVLVVEAGERSGSLITAGCAADQGRTVFAIPGPIGRPQSRGTLGLLRDGAVLATSAGDILRELGMPLEALQDETREREAVPPDLPEGEAGKLWSALADEPFHPDEVAARTGLETRLVLALLLELEVGGWVSRCEGGLFYRERRSGKV